MAWWEQATARRSAEIVSQKRRNANLEHLTSRVCPVTPAPHGPAALVAIPVYALQRASGDNPTKRPEAGNPLMLSRP